MDYEEVIKKRNQAVYVPNWFSVDIKTGVSYSRNIPRHSEAPHSQKIEAKATRLHVPKNSGQAVKVK